MLTSCDSNSDSDCDGLAILSFKNETTFSITLILNGAIEKTISPGQTHIVNVIPGSVTYSATAGQFNWGKTLDLEACDATAISLT